jgi:hypothetical protein
MQPMELFPDGQFGRTSQEPCRPTMDEILEQSSTKWLKQGRISKSTLCWTLNTSESPNDAGACSSSLALILQPPTMSNPLLPVTESLRGDTKKGKPKGQSVASQVADSVRGDGGILGSEIVGSLNTSDAKMISTQYVNENKCVVEPYVKSRRAQTSTDDETWVHGEVNPTLNSFDVGDTRATTAIVEPVLFENSYRDGARIANDGVTQTLSAKMGTGGGNTPNDRHTNTRWS